MKVKEAIKKTNLIFVNLILIFFYIFIIGFGALIWKILKRFLTKKDSYWSNEVKEIGNVDYFQSPY